jgi:hypothetical protein
VATGISAYEYVHGGLRYQYTDITQLGFFVGGDLELNSDIIFTWAIDHMIHFGNNSYNSNRPFWYARQGLTNARHTTDENNERKNTYINLSLGREIQVNNWLGFNADLGINWRVRYEKTVNGTTTIDNLRRVLPSARIQAFISF